MAYPRITALISLILLLGSLSLLCIGALALINPAYPPGSNVERVNGEIVAIGSNMDFVLETAAGEYMHFHCGDTCQKSLRHLQRHLYEHAATYVYYTEETNKSLMALDVD
jgi:hypothetical protein